MADDQKGAIRAASDGGVAGEHVAVEPFEFLVGPTTTDQFNTARLRLIPIACWRVDDVRFAFDSSFVNADPDPDNSNDIRAELRHLVDLIKDHPGAPLSVFGHADPVGSDDYNKLLSGRRAKVIYGLLISNTDPGTAVKLWKDVSNTEAWGANQRQTMQTVTGLPSGTPDSTLFRSYMQKLCPPTLSLSKKDFLAQGADSGGKGDFQGCSEFNPLLIFSQETQAQFDQAKQQNDKEGIEKRNAENAPNRRVMVLMFRKGSRVDPARWPCPRATEGVAGCIKRFWSDGEKRRSTHLPNNIDRKFEDANDTFACRFYQRISDESPCDRILRRLRVRLYDAFGTALPFAPFAVAVGGSQKFTSLNRADENGIITVALSDVEGPVNSVTVNWGFKPKKDEEPVLLFSRAIFLVAEGEQGDEAFIKKLSNLGYDEDDKVQNIIGFQLDYGPLVDPFLAVTGELDDRTRKLLDEVYEQSADHLRETKVENG